MSNECPVCYRNYTAGLWTHISECARKRAEEERKRDERAVIDNAGRALEGLRR